MGEVRIEYEDAWMKSLLALFNGTPPKPGALTREALGLYEWALRERAKGRYIVSMNEDLSDPLRLAMPSIERVRQEPPSPPPAPAAADAPTVPTRLQFVR